MSRPYKRIIKKSVFATLVKAQFTEGLDQDFRDISKELYINPDAISREVSCITVHALGINMNSLCLRNENGGYEFYNSEFMEEPATLLHSGITIIHHHPVQPTKECYVFYSLLDYLAFKNLQYEDNLPKEVSLCKDSLIIGDESNLIDAMLEADTYSKVYCFFPYTLVGRTINTTFIYRNPNVNIDVSDFYQEYKTLFDYNKHLKIEQTPHPILQT